MLKSHYVMSILFNSKKMFYCFSKDIEVGFFKHISSILIDNLILAFLNRERCLNIALLLVECELCSFDLIYLNLFELIQTY